MAVMTSAGSKLHIATGTPATYNQAGFENVALTYVEVGEIVDLGEFGAEYNLVTHTALGQRQQKKFKGSFNNGALQLQMARDTSNTGQTALRTALNDDASFSFKVTLQDNTKIYFTGKVMSYKTSVGSVDQITGATTTIEIDSVIVEVAPV
jgi:hypothetical protein